MKQQKKRVNISKSLDKDNRFVMMVNAGSKGSISIFHK